jgi:hypothetical protein
MKRRPSRQDDKAIAIQQPLRDQIADSASERDAGNKIAGVLESSQASSGNVIKAGCLRRIRTSAARCISSSVAAAAA